MCDNSRYGYYCIQQQGKNKKKKKKEKKKELKNKNDFKLWDACHVERRPFCFPVRGCARAWWEKNSNKGKKKKEKKKKNE